MQRIMAAVLIALCWLGDVGATERSTVPDLATVKVLDLKTAQALALAGNPDMAAAEARINGGAGAVSERPAAAA